MVQAGHRFHFVEELLPAHGVGHRLRSDYFQGDDPIPFQVTSLENLAQAPLSQTIED